MYIERVSDPPRTRARLSRLLDFAIVGLLIALVALAFARGARAQDLELINGTPADPAEWPASVYASMSGAACSATVVGERVLLIASHCVGNGSTARFNVGANQYTSTCTHHPDYRNNSTADWALCVVNRKVEGIPYEKVGSDASWCRAGAKVRLTGYGCIRSGGGGGNDGIYRIGEATVQSCPTGARNFDTVTRGGAALCYGDSGGPAFLERADGGREIFGVNSRGDISTTSYLSSTYVEPAKTWFASWAAAKGVAICGVSPDARGCRGSAEPPPPPPPPPPPADCGPELAAAVGTQAEAGAAVTALKACMEAGI